jgi:transcriptional regulator with XRE-family HTH domain
MTTAYAPEVEQDTEYKTRLGLVLRTARYVREMTRDEVGVLCGVDGETVARWERANVDLRGHSLARLAEALGLPADLLLDPPATRSETLVRIAAYDAVRGPLGAP